MVSPTQSYITKTKQTINTSVLSFDSVDDGEFWYGARDRLVHSKNGKIITDTSAELRDVVAVVGEGNNAWYAREIGGLYFYDSTNNTHTSITNTSRAQRLIVKAPNGDLISINSDNIERIDTSALTSIKSTGQSSRQSKDASEFAAPSLIQDFKHALIDLRHDGNQVTVFFDSGDVALFDLRTLQYQILDFAPATTQCVAHVDKSPFWWLAQQDGTLLRFNQSNGQSDRFGRSDGLPLGGVNGRYCGVYQGHVVFSTERGLFKTNPLLNDSNTLVPQSDLYFARSNEAEAQVTDKAIKQVEHDRFPLTFRITNSSYQNISQNQTQYKIVGVAGSKNQWQSLAHGTNHLELPHLPQGNYSFIAQVSNNDGG
ncbi:MAG: hypothetical protein MJK04_06885, partial [Psychrosphaera sp.]|nr:hypothetical protein [Psychrosphaera sp.]